MSSSSSPPKPSTTYRLNTRGVFLTYPQCPAPRETIKEMLEAKGLTILKGLVGQENHQDGNLHLHAYAKFAKPVNYKDPRCFDITWQQNVYHGKYEPAKSAIGSIKYCSKHDKEPLELGDMDWKQELEAKKDKKRVLGKRLADGEKLIDLIDDNNQELIFKYKDIEANVQAYHNAKLRNKPDCKEEMPNTWDFLLGLYEPEHKKRHYWFYTNVPNKGKTTFLKNMDNNYRCSWYNKAENYQDIHKDSQFLLIDEYSTADIKVTTLNQMCDGTFLYPVKGGASTKLKKPYILVCGNKNPAELYPNAWKYIEARFNVQCLDDQVQTPQWPPILQVTKTAQAATCIRNPFAK